MLAVAGGRGLIGHPFPLSLNEFDRPRAVELSERAVRSALVRCSITRNSLGLGRTR